MNEIEYIRELAKKQAEYAALPIMNERRKKWYALNDGKLSISPWCNEDYISEQIHGRKIVNHRKP